MKVIYLLYKIFKKSSQRYTKVFVLVVPHSCFTLCVCTPNTTPNLYVSYSLLLRPVTLGWSLTITGPVQRDFSYPYVKLSRKEALRNSSSIKASPSDVHHSHEEEPAHLAHCGGLDKALSDGKVHGGHNTTQAKSQEHS